MPTKRVQRFAFSTKWESKQTKSLAVLARCSKVELAYLAGIIDGEGTISFRKMQGGYYRPILEITNTSPELIQYLRRFFWQAVVSCKNGRQVPYLRVKLAGFGIGPFLKALDPYLVAKRLQGRLVMRYITMRCAQPWRSPPSEEMLEVYRDVRALNSHGPESAASKMAVRKKHSST